MNEEIIFYDAEFTGLQKNSTLISIGFASKSGRTFYAEFTDYDKNQVNEWILNNVISNTLYLSNAKNNKSIETEAEVSIYGDKEFIRRELIKWFNSFKLYENNKTIQFVSDVSHYDFVLLIDLFGSAFDLPRYICPTCVDINQKIASHFSISNFEAFNLSREKLAGYSGNDKKHNALFDFKILKMICDRYSFA